MDSILEPVAAVTSTSTRPKALIKNGLENLSCQKFCEKLTKGSKEAPPLNEFAKSPDTPRK